MSEFWTFLDCQYARVLNFHGYTRVTYFCKYNKVLNMHRDAIMEGFWIFQDSKYARFLQMQVLHKVLNMPEYGWIMSEETVLIKTGIWICLVKVWQSFKCASSSKYARVQNMARLWICEGYTGSWICLNKPEYTSICINVLHNAEYAWKCLHTAE